MSVTVLSCIQFLLAWFEVWLCYQLTAVIIPEFEYSRVKNKVIMWGNIIVLGSLMAINRNILFFSGTMFLFYSIATIVCQTVSGENRACLVVFPYYSLIALFDFFFAFMSMTFLEQDFLQTVYYRTVSVWQIVIFFCTRSIIVCVIGVLYRIKIGGNINLLDFKNAIILLSIMSYVILKKYQSIMAEMTYGNRNMRGYDAAFSLLFIIMIIIFGVLFFYKYQGIQREKEFLISREAMTEQYYHDMGEIIEGNRQFVHDVKNHFLVLKGYSESGDLKGLNQYLRELNEEFLIEAKMIKTGQRIVDIVLNQKRNEAEKLGISFEYQAMSGILLPLKDSELCALLGNLLDNALEACEKIGEKQCWIQVTLEKKGKMVLLEVANSIGEMPKQKDGQLITSKTDKAIHGYGLKSVRRIVDKYEGDFSYQIKESAFYAAVTFFDTEKTS